jgi:diacylglycerol kinase family enzyme
MKGKYFGGGVMITPGQDRNDPEGKVSVLVWHAGRIFTLTKFSKSYTGGHVVYTDNVDIIRGGEIEVEFGSLTDMQIDGEPMMNVNTYKVHTRTI